MRNSLITLFLYFSLSLSGATYYVATNGSDGNPGTVSQPWLTMQKGFNSISPGDILYIRGGTYSPTGTVAGGMISGVVVNGKKGSSSNMYNVFAYPGEVPVLDCRNITNGSYSRIGILILSSDYWYIKGIEITRVDQYKGPPSNGGQGLLIQSGNNNKIETVVSHHNGGPGLGIRDNSEGNLFLNCDAYSNYDPYSSSPGDNADGFDIGFVTARSGNERVNTLIGCRVWLNSDDGYDMYQYPGYHGIYILKDCWAWKNGYKSDGVSASGDGNGFKYGADNNYSLDGTVRRSTYNCIAYANRQRGYSQESANVKMLFYNNIAYQNGSWGFSFYYYDVADVLRNNISYKNNDGQIENQGSKRIHDHNSWDSKVTISDADFASLDASQLLLARKSDGSLPDMKFFHLATGSDFINAGVNVGLPYGGTAPDIGTFEVQSATVDPDPVFVFATVENATPSLLEMNYDLDLNSQVIPAASSYTVLVNSQARTVSSVSVSGQTVNLNLSPALKYGDVVLVSYTKPAANPIQTSTGKAAASCSSETVTNNVKAPVPAYVSSAVANGSPAVIEITYNMTLASITPAASAFKVLVNSSSRSVSSVSVSGTKVLLTLSSPVVYGNNVTVSYTKPSSKPLQTSAGAQAAAIGAQKVTNNVTATAPLYVSSAIQNTTSSRLEITYNMSLANVVPAASSFKVLVNSTSRAVSAVAISGTKVLLTLSGPVVYGNVVTVSYTKPSVNQLQASSGAQAATISAQNVTNNVGSFANVAPTVDLTAPDNNSTYTEPAIIEITADASDVDGTITLVEFYNGSTRIGSKSSAPYSFTWNNVIQGTYSITAVATDNKGATTTSSAISVSVESVIPPVENQSPVVSIASPTKGNRFENPADIEIQVSASDPDGTIRKVELFNGTLKLGEITAAPFSFTWKGVSTGKYKIKAVATDDLKATTTSSIVEFTVNAKTAYDAKSDIIKLYPNPNHGHFTITFLVPLENEKNEIIISDLNGNQVYREPITAEETTKQIDLPNVRSGIYIMTVISNEIIVTKKIMIK